MKKNNAKKDELKERLSGMNIPLLILDNKWYELFSIYEKTPVIKNLEKRLKNLVLKQSNLGGQIKELVKKKKNLMASFIVDTTSGIHAVNSEKEEKKSELDDYTDKINKYNNEINKCKEKLDLIPEQIKQVNEELVIECMLFLDNILINNEIDIDNINKYIIDIKEEVKNKLLIRNDKEEKNKSIYSYMHDILGTDIMEEFDGITQYILKKEREDDRK